MRRPILLLIPILLLLLAGGALWLVLGDSEDGGQGSHANGDAAGIGEAGSGDVDDDGGRAGSRARRPGVVLGRVLFYGTSEPAPGLTVTLVTPTGGETTVTTASDGQFSFTPVAPGAPYGVQLDDGEHSPVVRSDISVRPGERVDIGELWLAQGVPVHVEVVTFSGQPIPGARVRAFEADRTETFDILANPSPVGSAVAGDDGIAVFAGLPPGSWTITAERTGYARRGLTSVDVRAGVERETFRLPLDAAAQLSGHVIDRRGKPVAGATVHALRRTLTDEWATSPLIHRTTTGEDGSFHFGTLPTADTVLWSGWPGGELAVVAAVRLPGVSEIDIVLEEGGRVEGTVVSATTGAPVVGAKVLVSTTVMDAYTLNIETTTDADGRYVQDLPMPCVLEYIQANASGFGESYADLGLEAAIAIPTGFVATCDIEMVAGLTVTGRITGPNGPIANAEVGATNPSYWFSTQSDVNGEYRLPALPDGEYFILARRTGYRMPQLPDNPDHALTTGTADPAFIVEAPGAGAATIDIAMEAGAPIHGQIVDEDSKPIKGAVVQIWGDPSVSSTSDAEGMFELGSLDPGESVWIVAEAEGYRDISMSVEGSNEERELVYSMRKAPRVSGVVSTDDGAPLDGAFVQIVSWDESTLHPTQNEWNELGAVRLPVNPDGSFDHPVTEDVERVFVRAGAIGRVSKNSRRLDVRGDGDHVIELVLGRGYEIHGRVVTPAGTPVPRANVSMMPLAANAAAPNADEYPGAWGPPIVAVSDVDGRFTVTGVAQGRHGVRAWTVDHLPGEVLCEAPTDDEVVIEVRESRLLEGVVRFPDGSPAAGVRVVADSRFDARRADVRTDSAGRFVMTHMPGEAVSIWAGNAPESPSNVVTTESQEVEAGRGDVEIVIQRGLEISGNLRMGDGTPLEEVSVSVEYEGQRESAYIATDADGFFKADSLPRTPATLTFWTEEMHDIGSIVLRGVEPGGEPLDVRVPELPEMSGVAIGPEGEPLANIDLSFEPVDGTAVDGLQATSVSTTADESGEFSVESIRGVEYRVSLSYDDRLTFPHDTLISGGSADNRLTAILGETVKGRIVDESGNTIAGAWVYLTGDGTYRNAVAGDEGTFSLGGLRVGMKYTLYAGAENFRDSATVEVAAGTENVVLTLTPGLPVSGRVVDLRGEELPGVYFEIVARDGVEYSSSTWVNSDGGFDFSGLPDSTFDVFVSFLGERIPCGVVRAGDRNIVITVPRE